MNILTTILAILGGFTLLSGIVFVLLWTYNREYLNELIARIVERVKR